MEFVSVGKSLITFNKVDLMGKFIKFDKSKDHLDYDLDRFTMWLEKHFIVDTMDYFQDNIVFEIIYVKEPLDYCSPGNRSYK